MGLIENPKTYTGRDLETIFFRPMFAGESAEQLGIRTLYNMPVPTTIHMWSPRSNVLANYSSGWSGGDSAIRQQKTIELHKVKAEVGFSASDYFRQVYELITGRADVNLDDLTGTELEQAETEMFRRAIAESVRVMMWLGDISGPVYNKFDGFLTLAARYSARSGMSIVNCGGIALDADHVALANELLHVLRLLAHDDAWNEVCDLSLSLLAGLSTASLNLQIAIWLPDVYFTSGSLVNLPIAL